MKLFCCFCSRTSSEFGCVRVILFSFPDSDSDSSQGQESGIGTTHQATHNIKPAGKQQEEGEDWSSDHSMRLSNNTHSLHPKTGGNLSPFLTIKFG